MEQTPPSFSETYLLVQRNVVESEKQVVEARQRTRATDLVTLRRPSKHHNPPAQPMLAFDQVLADLETKLLQQYRLLQGTLTQVMKRD
ncbi:MAG: hypothetical protein EZS28_020922 [Streblomastix strix]|uniref:Uncharacterized protein n=1 Tax=Streblomastix strix TaxID=222440 RepID=A0A5J4VMQ4_9EUKA|nr:MAG: hypothetical protein EZS28_020922 [Streblomastix strix]